MAFLGQLFHSQMACSGVIRGVQLNGGLHLHLTRKIHLQLRALLEIFLCIYTIKEGCFPILHDNCLSHHTGLSFPLRRKGLSLPFIPHYTSTTLWEQAAQQTPLASPGTAASCGAWQLIIAFGKCSVPLTVATCRAEQKGFPLPGLNSRSSSSPLALPVPTGTGGHTRGTQQVCSSSPKQLAPILLNGPQKMSLG